MEYRSVTLFMINVENKLYGRTFPNIFRFIWFDPRIALCFCCVFICVDTIVIIYEISVVTNSVSI